MIILSRSSSPSLFFIFLKWRPAQEEEKNKSLEKKYIEVDDGDVLPSRKKIYVQTKLF